MLRSEVTGGVQLCSQEFHHIIEQIPDINLSDYFVPYTRKISQRLLIKMGMENYSMYDVKKDAPALLEHIQKNGIDIVFMNMSSMVRYARPIREAFGPRVKIVLLSHGNHSGDFLHLLTKPLGRPSAIRRMLDKIRLGMLIATESGHRVRYLDGVVALSETEKQIENWFGAKKTSFLPRRLYAEFLPHDPVPGRVGFVGRLDHPPNLQGISLLLDQIKPEVHRSVSFRLVGAPESFGRDLQKRYPFIEYLGELSDAGLEKEVATWSIFLNPVWWYSTGASTKLARAISWGVPILSTTAGMRGYRWKEGALLVADTPEEMAGVLLRVAPDATQVRHWAEQTRLIAVNGPSMEDLAAQIKYIYQ
ncbi:glycosyltransferase [Puia dinghuensis]|uniref:glycosyltransferase n=1 Tax=Puia dinghuensis TaxID=1792502 RepID=UPI0016679EDF|nr:glycosyltransferase [Puia dinghuensis]